MTWEKNHHYPERIEFEDISIALNEVDSWIDILASKEAYLPPKYDPKKREILVAMTNGLVRPHSVNPHALCVKKITYFINVKATKP